VQADVGEERGKVGEKLKAERPKLKAFSSNSFGLFALGFLLK